MNHSEHPQPDDAQLATRQDEAPIRQPAPWLMRQAADLDPACFAVVMATGIISNAFFLHGYRELSDVLFALNLVVYPALCGQMLVRALRFGARLKADLGNPRLVFSFFTFVAGSDVLGIAFVLRGLDPVALAFWLVAAAAWLALIYLGFGVLMLINSADGARPSGGAWLNAIVGTQSLVVLGARVATANAGPMAFLLIHALWTIGLGLYAIYVVLLCYRMFFFDLKPEEVTPLLWVVMGAAAISANAGATLVADAGETRFLLFLLPFVGGITLAMWSWATWWIPLLILLGIWKHGIHRIPISTTTMLWSMVFPLGMYAVATLRLSRVAEVPALQALSWVFAWIALAAWTGTAAAFAAASVRDLRVRAGARPQPR